MSKRILSLIFLVALLPGAAFASSFTASLSGSAEVPGPGDTDGVGVAVVTVEGTTLTYSVLTQNIAPATSAHIHAGAAGVAGGPVVTLDHNALAWGSATITQELANQITANPAGFYVNVHTGDFPNGAIRGQLAESPAEGGAMTLWLPVVSKTKGAAGTNFVTDLRVVNRNVSTAHLTLDYYAASLAGHASPTTSKQVTVAPGEQAVLDDVVGSTLAQGDSSFGGLKISSDQPVVAFARIINDLRGEGKGTAGLAMPAVESAGTGSTLAFLTQNADYRANVGWFNPSASAVTATFTARRTADGSVLGSRTIEIPGYAMFQQNAFDLISTVPAADRTQADFYVTWEANAPLLVYGAVTDNRTGDAVAVQ